MFRVLVTGGTGFVGGHLVRHLRCRTDWSVRVSTRGAPSALSDSPECVRVGDLDAQTDWRDALRDVDVVVHCAARVHAMDQRHPDLAAYERVNVEGTLQLARSAAAAGCRRFVFISSIKVNGEGTTGRPAYSECDPPSPVDPYGASKLAAEQALFSLGEQAGMAVVVIRPPLVYGPGVKANFLSLMTWVRRGIPLPLGGIRNRRSLVGIDNLVDFIRTCIEHPEAPGQVFLVSDGEDVSTPQLIRRMAHALGARARLLPVPAGVMSAIAGWLGRGAVIERLCGDLCVDITKARTRLQWCPPVSLDEGLKRIVASADKVVR